MNTLKQTIIGSMLLFMATFSLVPVAPVYAAEPIDEACAAINCDDPKGLKLDNVISKVITILGGLIGVAAVVMIMVSGFKYVTASGDSAKIASAKNTLVYAVIGLFIAALAQIIVRYVIDVTV